MKTIAIHINIGSNSGHREALIEQAVAAISSAFPGAAVSRSGIVETPPWGFDSPNPFLNIGVMVEGRFSDIAAVLKNGTDDKSRSESPEQVSDSFSKSNQDCRGGKAVLATLHDEISLTMLREEVALAVLRKLQDIQRSIDPSPHRDAEGRYIDRAIDIDLIAIDDWVVDTPELTLPHPRMHLRDFVLIPLAGLAPTWRHPLTGKTATQHLSDLTD